MDLIMKTIGECLEERARTTPDKIAVETDGNEKDYTWAELNELSDYMAVRMRSSGICAGTHAGVWGTNSPDWIILFLALVKTGAVPVLLNTCYTVPELEQVLRYADVEYVYYGEGYKKLLYGDMVNRLRAPLGDQVKQWIPMGRATGRRWLTQEDFETAEKSKESLENLKQAKKRVMASDTAAILFTSGTTAAPKGVMLSHYNLVNSALETCRYMEWGEEDKMLIAVPLFHCFGITSCLLSAIHSGFAMHVIEYYKTIHVLKSVQEYRCTLLNGVPSMFLAMIYNPAMPEYDVSSLKKGIIAGSPYSSEEYMRIRRAIPSLKLYASYGQTETSPCVSIGRAGDTDEDNARTSGQVNDQVEVGIFDLDTCRQVEAGQTGEIRVRGYNVMQGYYNLPEETARTVDSRGWLKTGDLGRLDERNHLYVTGRLKEMIIRGGENISPREIEEAIAGYPGVHAVKVIGLPAQVLQEIIAACIIPVQGERLDSQGLRQYLKDRIAYYKMPEHVLLFDKFPMSASGKVLTGELKKLAIQRINKMTEQES